ncbi:hypothetical protein [Methylopila sp. M107]|uniref:hypothetical protein n=1 Tax=Methylopila sp. M107 TaxID=1101190 RepID=UPI000368F3A8|nr:hypothetical protein [Methylopila sp. M107]
MTPTDRQFAAYFGIPLRGDSSALDNAAEHFANAAEGEDPLVQCSLALRSFLLAYVRGELVSQPFDAARFWDLSARAGMTLVRHTDALSLNRAISGFDNFRELIALFALPEVPELEKRGPLVDRLDQVAMFADELDVLWRRAKINSRGAPLVRYRAFQAAVCAENPTGLVH